MMHYPVVGSPVYPVYPVYQSPSGHPLYIVQFHNGLNHLYGINIGAIQPPNPSEVSDIKKLVGQIYTGRYKGKNVVLKIITEPHQRSEYEKSQLIIRANSGRPHPNIIEYFNIVQTPLGPAIAMPRGLGSMNDVISFETKPRLYGYLQSVSDGINFLHSKEMAHGDLKLENVFIIQTSQSGKTKAVIGDLETVGPTSPIRPDSRVTYIPPSTLFSSNITNQDFDTYSMALMGLAAAIKKSPIAMMPCLWLLPKAKSPPIPSKPINQAIPLLEQVISIFQKELADPQLSSENKTLVEEGINRLTNELEAISSKIEASHTFKFERNGVSMSYTLSIGWDSTNNKHTFTILSSDKEEIETGVFTDGNIKKMSEGGYRVSNLSLQTIEGLALSYYQSRPLHSPS